MSNELETYLEELRREFAGRPLDKESVTINPIKQFEIWFEEAIKSKIVDPFAMAIATVNNEGQPSTRIVYMRGIKEEGFIFYTNYNSDKGNDLAQNNKVGLNFFWEELNRQVRVEGEVIKVSEEQSNTYFSKRPRESQIGAWASSQSEKILDRKVLKEKVIEYTNKFKNDDVPRPAHWGGYIVIPKKIEFWQGQPNRLHDRLVYTKDGDDWKLDRVSP